MQLLETLLDLGEQRSARDRHDDMVGGLPSELLGGLEREGLRSLRVVGPHVDVHERPLVQPGELRAQAVDVVVVAVDGNDVAAVDRRGDDLALFEVGGDEHVRAQPGVRGVRGDRVGEVAGRSTGRDLEAELERLAQRDGDDPVLERVRRVAGVVLQPHLAEAELRREAVGPHERREPRPEVDRGIGPHREEVAVAPQRERPGGDLLAAGRGGDRLVVVGHFERAEAPLARVDRRGLVLTTALPTAEPVHVGPEILDRFLSLLPFDALSSASSGRPLLGCLIGQALAPCFPTPSGCPGGSGRWLPRLQRACPSAALDERVHAAA